MAYISFDFYIFLALLLCVYYLLPKKYRWYSLLVGSISFYWHISGSEKQGFFIFIGESFFCWLLCLLTQKTAKFKKPLFFLSVLSLALPLFAVKEARFTAEIILRRNLPEWWLFPVGIAFYSMQLLSYASDVYTGKIEPEGNFLKFLLFSSFFPQIIQGPIPRYGQLSHQLTEGHGLDERKFTKGFMLILWGFFLKLCIADKAGIVVDRVFDNFPAYQGMYVLIAGILYSLQLYADFYACSSLAQGIAALFGIDIIDNFKRPYLSSSVKDFWRRWHISLSLWLRDYIYIPLGGNKKGAFRKHINILITFLVSGIWHGGGFKFLAWGLMHGAYQVAEDLLKPIRDKISSRRFFIRFGVLRRLAASVFTFIAVMFAWIIFRADYLRTGLKMIGTVFTVRNYWILTDDSLYTLGLEWKEFHILLFCLAVLLIVSVLQERGLEIRDRILGSNIIVRWSLYIAAILFIIIFGTYGYGFDAQSFIYGRF